MTLALKIKKKQFVKPIVLNKKLNNKPLNESFQKKTKILKLINFINTSLKKQLLWGRILLIKKRNVLISIPGMFLISLQLKPKKIGFLQVIKTKIQVKKQKKYKVLNSHVKKLIRNKIKPFYFQKGKIYFKSLNINKNKYKLNFITKLLKH